MCAVRWHLPSETSPSIQQLAQQSSQKYGLVNGHLWGAESSHKFWVLSSQVHRNLCRNVWQAAGSSCWMRPLGYDIVGCVPQRIQGVLHAVSQINSERDEIHTRRLILIGHWLRVSNQRQCAVDTNTTYAWTGAQTDALFCCPDPSTRSALISHMLE